MNMNKTVSRWLGVLFVCVFILGPLGIGRIGVTDVSALPLAKTNQNNSKDKKSDQDKSEGKQESKCTKDKTCKPGCANSCPMSKKTQSTGASAEQDTTVKLCGHCSEIKGSARCCAMDAEICPKCGLHKGSPGCCKITKGDKDVFLCPKYGEIKGSAKCCARDAEICPKCGLHKGSPGCCKIKKEASEKKEI
jgi:hypothetical protein